eukprot:scaffold27545_cov52-Phaeocystis_antarctica.AAC.2
MPPVRLSAVRVGVQSAAELRHLQRHNHEAHVHRALLPVPCPESAVEPPLHDGRRRPRLLARTHPRTAHRMPSVRLSAGRVGVQPAAGLRHLQRHDHGPDVPGVLLPVPCSRNCSRALSRTLRAPRSPDDSRLPATAPRPASYALLSTLGRARRRSTSR